MVSESSAYLFSMSSCVCFGPPPNGESMVKKAGRIELTSSYESPLNILAKMELMEALDVVVSPMPLMPTCHGSPWSAPDRRPNLEALAMIQPYWLAGPRSAARPRVWADD